jgi:hypothetical protein
MQNIILILSLVMLNLWLYAGYKKIKPADLELIYTEVIDNKAQWVYNNSLYYAEVVDNRIDNKTIRKITL